MEDTLDKSIDFLGISYCNEHPGTKKNIKSVALQNWGLRNLICGFLDYPPIMVYDPPTNENQTEKNMEFEMESI